MPGRFDLADYVDVQERIVEFWAKNPDGSLITRLDSPPDDFDRVVFRAEVYRHRDDERPTATGYAAEIAGTGGANQTSWHENAETSAIGRALANLGYAKSRKDRPSRQEMAKVNRATAPANGSARPGPADVVSRAGGVRELAAGLGEPLAFTDQASGQAYVVDSDTGEIIEAEARVVEDEPEWKPPKASKSDMKRLHAMAEDRQVSHEALHDLLLALRGVPSLARASIEDINELEGWLDPYDQGAAGDIVKSVRAVWKAETVEALGKEWRAVKDSYGQDERLKGVFGRRGAIVRGGQAA